MLAEYGDAETLSAEQYRTESGNMATYGFGTKSYTLSMVETALSVSGGAVSAATLSAILALGKQLLNHPMQLLDGVEEVLPALRDRYRLVIVTKGDLLEQQRKLERSGLKKYFHHIEIMSDKQPADYAAMLERLGVEAEGFVMVGNSVKSDILPVLSLGAHAVHIPFHDNWIHEIAEPPTDHACYYQVDSIRQLPALPLLGGKA